MNTIKWVADASCTYAIIGRFKLIVHLFNGVNRYRVSLYDMHASYRLYFVDFCAMNEILAHRYAIEHFEDYLNDKILPYSTALVAVKEYLELAQ